MNISLKLSETEMRLVQVFLKTDVFSFFFFFFFLSSRTELQKVNNQRNQIKKNAKQNPNKGT